MARFFDAAAAPAPSLKVVAREINRCVQCPPNSFPQLSFPLQWDLEQSELDDSGCDGLIQEFVHFVLHKVQTIWYCSEADMSDTDTRPLADITVVIPASDEPLLPDDSTSHLCRVKRRLLRRNTLDESKGKSDLEVCDRFEILTDAHLSDCLELISTLPPFQISKVEILFTTSLYPAICPSHSDSVARSVAQVKCKSRQFVGGASLKVKHSIRKLKDLVRFEHDDDYSSDEGDDGERLQGRLRRGWGTIKRAFKLPEVGRLLKTGLYSPIYLERQIHEVLDSLKGSIARGFAINQPLG